MTDQPTDRPDAITHLCLAIDHMIEAAVKASIVTEDESRAVKNALWDMNIALRKRDEHPDEQVAA